MHFLWHCGGVKRGHLLARIASRKQELQSIADHHISISHPVQAVYSNCNRVNNVHSTYLSDWVRSGCVFMFYSWESSRFWSVERRGRAPLSISKVIGFWTKDHWCHTLLWLLFEGFKVQTFSKWAPIRHEVQRSLPQFLGNYPISRVVVHRYPIRNKTFYTCMKHNLSIILSV